MLFFLFQLCETFSLPLSHYYGSYGYLLKKFICFYSLLFFCEFSLGYNCVPRVKMTSFLNISFFCSVFFVIFVQKS